MSLFDKEERLLLPEWTKSIDSLKSPEIKPFNGGDFSSLSDNTDDLYENFVLNKNLGSAIELLNVAYIENREAESRVAARFIVQGFDLPPQILQFAKFILRGGKHDSEPTETQKPIISILRGWLHNNPKDALAWLDLARAYVSIGKLDSAEKTVTVGTNLLPNHRWIIRVASRFYVNNNQSDKAHYLLSKHPMLKEDPWLLSAEIAVAESYNRPLKMVSQARKLIESERFSPLHLTELESSIATIELSNGALKKAKKLYVSSLRKPNDNSLAQAKWAERNANLSNLVNSELLFSQQGAYEAKMWEKYYNYDLSSAIDFGIKWFEDESYSVQPAIMVTYLSSVLDNYALCYEYAVKGLGIDKHDETLILNKLFSEICLLDRVEQCINWERVKEWEGVLKSLAAVDNENTAAHANANLGLLHYKTNRFELGKEYYAIACDLFSKSKNASGIVANMNHYRECVLADVSWKDEVFYEMEQAYKNSLARKEPALVYYFIKMNMLKENPLKWDEIKSTSLDLSNLIAKEEKKDKIVTFDFDPKSPKIIISK